MESVLSHVGAVFCHGTKGLAEKKREVIGTHLNTCSFGINGVDGKRKRSVVLVKAETGAVSINPDVRKNEEKVVDSVVVTELSKAVTPYCR